MGEAESALHLVDCVRSDMRIVKAQRRNAELEAKRAAAMLRTVTAAKDLEIERLKDDLMREGSRVNSARRYAEKYRNAVRSPNTSYSRPQDFPWELSND